MIIPRKKWLRSFGPDKEVWTVKEKGTAAIYLTRDKPNGDPYARMPVYHVWRGDVWLYCGASQRKAEEVFGKAEKEISSG